VEAGHDYEGLAARGMRQVVVERNGRVSIEERDGGNRIGGPASGDLSAGKPPNLNISFQRRFDPA
jgi:hypothetical protein